MYYTYILIVISYGSGLDSCRLRPRTHGNVFLRSCIVYCSQGIENLLYPGHFLSTVKNRWICRSYDWLFSIGLLAILYYAWRTILFFDAVHLNRLLWPRLCVCNSKEWFVPKEARKANLDAHKCIRQFIQG